MRIISTAVAKYALSKTVNFITFVTPVYTYNLIKILNFLNIHKAAIENIRGTIYTVLIEKERNKNETLSFSRGAATLRTGRREKPQRETAMTNVKFRPQTWM